MNEHQHDRLAEVQWAEANLSLAQTELTQAEAELRRRRRHLKQAVAADPASWHGTPGVEKHEHHLQL